MLKGTRIDAMEKEQVREFVIEVDEDDGTGVLRTLV